MQNIINMRDLGGIKTKSGQSIVKGKLFRSANPSLGTEEDYARLKQLAVDVFIDFRADEEKQDQDLQFDQCFKRVAQPISVGDLTGLLEDGMTKQEAYQIMCDIYSRFPVDFQSQYHYFLKQAEEGKTMFYHCTAGKDRTGFASLLLLSALGVDEAAIMQDYLLSNRVVEGLKKQIQFKAGNAINQEALQALLEVSSDYLVHALDAINQHYGDMNTYLTQVLNVDIERIKEQYLS